MAAWTQTAREPKAPVDALEARAWLRAGDDLDDHTIATLTAAAAARIEAETGLALTAQTWAVSTDAAGLRRDGAWSLLDAAVRPVRAIETAALIRADGNLVPIIPADAALDLDAGIIRLRTDALAAPGLRPFRPVALTLSCGFLPGTVPDVLRLCVLGLAAFAHEREGAPGLPALALPAALSRMLAPYRRLRL
jgi:uncharacterized phiE125 gp8 family phage protein